MSFVSEEKIANIIDKADIVSIISSYIKVSKKGRNYWSVCPFHEDSNPSMSISPEKKVYKCFSCGVGGNVLKFIEDFEKIDFIAALKKLASITQIDLSELNARTTKAKYDEKQEHIFKINADAMDFYQMVLNSKHGIEAKQYLAHRNISKEDIAKWHIGYASSEIKLFDKMLEKGYTQEELDEAGLISIKDDEILDFYFNRVIFPIWNEDNKVIGFSARTMQDIKPKYINSRENIVFKKSELAYNINNVSRTVNLKKYVIVLEGFMDVISLERIGIGNSIALMGTSLSDYHIKLFKWLKAEVKLFLDGDLAGINATIKMAKKLLAAGVKFSIIDNQTKNDPDELINAGKSEQVIEMIEKSIYPINFLIKKIFQFVDKQNPEQVKNYFNEIFYLIKMTNNNVIIDASLKMISEVSKTEINDIKKYFDEFQFIPENNVIHQQQIKQKKNISAANGQINKQKNSAYIKAEERVFISLLKSDQYLNKVEANIDYFNNPNTRMMVQGVVDEYRNGTFYGKDLQLILRLLEEKGMYFSDIILKLTNDELLNLKINENEIDDSFLVMQKYQIENEITQYEKKMKETTNYLEKKSIMRLIEGLHKKVVALEAKKRKGI